MITTSTVHICGQSIVCFFGELDEYIILLQGRSNNKSFICLNKHNNLPNMFRRRSFTNCKLESIIVISSITHLKSSSPRFPSLSSTALLTKLVAEIAAEIGLRTYRKSKEKQSKWISRQQAIKDVQQRASKKT